MSDRYCTVPDCDRYRVARGWCGMHYQRWAATGVEPSPPIFVVRVAKSPEQKREAMRAWHAANQSHERAYASAYYSAHKKAAAEYRRSRREVLAAYYRKRHAANPGPRRLAVLKYSRTHRDLINAKTIKVAGASLYIPSLPPELQEVARLLKQTRQAIRQAQSGSATK